MCMKNDMYAELKKRAMNHILIHHYTTIKSLENIITNNSLRLSRLDIVNDTYENKRINDVWKNKIFTSCFTYRENESYMFWKLYAGEEGVRLSFDSEYFRTNRISVYADSECRQCFEYYEKSDVTHKRNIDYLDWAIRDITYADIKYTSEFSQFEEIDPESATFFYNCNMLGKNKNFTFSLCPGLIKGIEWDSEQEVRLRVALSYKGMSNSVVNGSPCTPFKYIYIPINEAVKAITITMNPWHCQDFKERLIKLLKSNPLTCNCKVAESSMINQVKST